MPSKAQKRIAVVGAGRIGSTVVDLLAASGSYNVLVIDPAVGVDVRSNVDTSTTPVDGSPALASALSGAFAVVNCAPYQLTAHVARAARAAETHYLDLTEDVAQTAAVREIAESAARAFVPQCGLAPSFVGVVAWDLAGRFDEIHDLRLRVGALPRYPANALGYNLTWSPDGLVNEYCRPCEALVDGRLVETRPLEGLEGLAIDGTAYEAFNTSGGLGDLARSMQGRARNVDYKSMRYPGHGAIMRTLLQDLRLSERPAMLKEILELAIPATDQDLVAIFVTATGLRAGRLNQETYVNVVHGRTLAGRPRTAIQVTTASAVCAVLDLLAEGRLPQRGLVRQQDVRLADFLANRFGRAYVRQDPAALMFAAE